MITQIDHIGIAVKNLDEQVKFYTEVLGLKPVHSEIVNEQKVKTVMFPVGKVMVELLEATSKNSPIAKYIEKRGEGIHHIAYRVDDLQSHMDKIKSENVKLIDDSPQVGAKGLLIVFLHPHSTFGVLTELCQKIHDSENC